MPTVRGARTCNGCKTEKRAERFYESNPYRCKKCIRQDTRESRRDNPKQWSTYARRYALKRLYGMTHQDYSNLVERQGSKCAICRRNHIWRRGCNNFAVDHDHETGQIRGLLCHNCNRGLGHLKDSIELLESAIEYLKSSKEVRRA